MLEGKSPLGRGKDSVKLVAKLKSPTPRDDLLLIADKIGGETAVKIVSELEKKGLSTADEIAKNTGLNLVEIRKNLFKLKNFSIITSEIVQDRNTGWSIFYWKLRSDQLESIIRSQKRRVLEKLKERLEYEKNHDFYKCVNEKCGKRYTFEEAVEHLFKCPDCRSPMEHYDNSHIIRILERKIAELEEEVKHE
jgi:transcription initiation factor TFIIE subunit alpha